jgi:hypothetical protein
MLFSLITGLRHNKLVGLRGNGIERIIFEDPGDLLETQSALDHENHATTRGYVRIIALSV